MDGLRVAVVGGGLAGPLLVQGLLGAGVEATLCERDAGVAVRGQGFRIHLAPEGDLALRRCLPPHLYRLARATTPTPGAGVTIFDSDLNVLNRITDFDVADPEHGEHLVVDRMVLRQILTAGLGDTVSYGRTCTGYDELPDGGVRVLFADGSAVEADLLVAADGSGSVVRRQFLPHAQVIDAGLVSVYGKVPLDDEVRALVPPYALDGFSAVIGGDRSLPLAGVEYASDPNDAAAELAPGLTFDDTRDYVMWVLVTPAAEVASAGQDGRALVDVARKAVADWHPSLGAVLDHADPTTVRSSPIRTAVPLEHWETGPVTLVGDAIHCMVPAGIGAAVALRDAAELTERLTDVVRGGCTLREAVHAYEVEMLRYGFEAVAASQQTHRLTQ
ncbi:MAG: FAD-dependent monooxygenase [Streptosporangiales bacterium]|nr:FAD-dependent monooxygenase [Streptosporangiales bacterium]